MVSNILNLKLGEFEDVRKQPALQLWMKRDCNWRQVAMNKEEMAAFPASNDIALVLH